jgi:hypothetical protein
MRALFCLQSFQRNYDEYDISQRNKDVYLRATMPANDMQPPCQLEVGCQP